MSLSPPLDISFHISADWVLVRLVMIKNIALVRTSFVLLYFEKTWPEGSSQTALKGQAVAA